MALAALAGCNNVSESAGMVGSLMGCSYEAIVTDNDMLGNVLRTVRGIEINEETLSYVNHLLPQLSPSAQLISLDRLQALASSECTRLYLAKEGDHIHGMLSLVVFGIPTGTKAWVEDVVVDEKARGRGVGKLLTEHAIQVAREHGAHSVDLTSRPSREAANALYQRVGFEQRVTNVYRFQAS